jgi:hypothetical protein
VHAAARHPTERVDIAAQLMTPQIHHDMTVSLLRPPRCQNDAAAGSGRAEPTAARHPIGTAD